MEDVQSHAPQVALNIDRVGVRELKLPLLVRFTMSPTDTPPP